METKYYVTIKVLDENKDITAMLDIGKTVVVKKRYWKNSNTFFIVLALVV